MLTQECMEELVKLVNEELDSAHGLLRDKLDAIDAELTDVKARLSKLYDALETGKLSLDDLSPRIKELKASQDELSKARVQVEADMVVEGVQHVELDVVKSYAQDLHSLLEEGDFTQSKTFLRSFVKKVIINGDKAKIQYRLPMPPDGKRTQSVGVLPIDTLGGEGGNRTHSTPTSHRLLLEILAHLAAMGQLSQQLLSSLQQDGHSAEELANFGILTGRFFGLQDANQGKGGRP